MRIKLNRQGSHRCLTSLLLLFLILFLLLPASSCGGGGASSNPVTVTGIILEAPTTAVRGSIVTITPRAQTSSTSAAASCVAGTGDQGPGTAGRDLGPGNCSGDFQSPTACRLLVAGCSGEHLSVAAAPLPPTDVQSPNDVQSPTDTAHATATPYLIPLPGAWRGASTTLVPPDIRVTVESGTLLDSGGNAVISLTVQSGTEINWQLPDEVGTYVARASYQDFNTSAAVLVIEPPNGGGE
ncbi:MAG: hypothetical protein H7A35_07975 [Planctomycetales bacterium]|nr:hypothetical protein [bacterium]UNM09991.1 MAG: hypothetical protein H7A35_07975 [Planctomycetales bacterium]